MINKSKEIPAIVVENMNNNENKTQNNRVDEDYFKTA